MRSVAGVGVGFRRELAPALLADPRLVDFVEIVAETCRDAAARREAAAVAEVWPVVPHGVKLSLGSADGIELARAKELGRLAKELRAPLVSEHVSFVRAGGREIGHLTELPMTRASIAVVVKNVTALRRELPDIPLLLENVARAFVWDERDHEMSEGDFYAEIVRATGCDLLLDASNLYANARNTGDDPLALLASFPLEHVAMVHVAGGVLEDGFYFDTHAHDVPEEVYGLVERVREVRPGVPVLLERDASFGTGASIFAELARLRPPVRGDDERLPPAAPAAPARPAALDAAASEALAERQAHVALALTSSGGEATEAVVRARGVLQRKRADDALPLLPQLGPRLSQHDAMTLGRILESPRLPAMTAIADAMRIAESASARPELAAAALHDRALLRARFSFGAEGPRPRAMPWIAHDESGGRRVWTFKGFGAGAAVRVISRGATG